MAIFHLSAKPIQRSKGRSSVGASAYRAGVCLTDERTGEIHDYTKKQGVEYTEIITPTGEKINRQELWNLAEKAEQRKDGTPAKEYEMSLPEELTADQRKDLARVFATNLAKRHGCVVDMAIHAPGKGGDQRNHHVHLLCTTRKYQAHELGSKCDVELSDRDRAKKGLQGRKSELNITRASWAARCNQALAKAGHKTRISPKSLKTQGINRQPTIHLGVMATAMERKGKNTYRRKEIPAPTPDIEQKLKELEGIEQGITNARTKMRRWQEAKQIEKRQEEQRQRERNEQLQEERKKELQRQDQARAQQVEKTKLDKAKTQQIERPQNKPNRGMGR